MAEKQLTPGIVLALKDDLKMHRQAAVHHKGAADKIEKELEKLGVFVPTALDPLCQRGNNQ